MNHESSIPDALKRKILQVDSMLRMLQRTIDSPDSSVYMNEMSVVLDTAIEQMNECEQLRSQWVTEAVRSA